MNNRLCRPLCSPLLKPKKKTKKKPEFNPHDLIIPTIRALADRPDVLVVAILGWKDAHITDADRDLVVPANTRVADYLSYDAVLQHADLWINNAGLG